MKTELSVDTGQYSDKGRKPSNQDFHGIRVPQNALLTSKGIAVAMADGISSSDVSHIASETAVKTFLEDYYCTSETWSLKTSAERVLSAINTWLHSQTMRGPNRYDKNKGYVCTLSALIIKNRSAHIFHLGDTRVYRLNAEGLEQLTNDHRLWASENKSYLSRAVGIDEQCHFDYQTISIKIGDIFIIATDGIYEFISAKNIIRILKENSDNLDAAAKSITEYAIGEGSNDNLTIQIIRITSLPELPANKVKEQIDALPFPPQLKPRMEFDGYLLLRELHSNNRSSLFLAEDMTSQHKVVLKVPATDQSNNSDHLERFLMEEWIALRINSAHVLKAALPNKKRNYLYTVFEFIEGQTLAQWAVDNPKPPMEAVRGLIEQIAKGLHAFHRLEMLHQDLRPENIMIDKDGTVKIIDFGSAIIAGLHETNIEAPSTYLLGTALYSAPEYFLGAQGTIRSELFSLGVMTYFLLSGRYPYGTNVAKTKTLSGQRKLWYHSVLDDEREIPIWVDEAIRKAVNPLPERRHEELFEFIHDLRTPNQVFLNKVRPPLIERNPVAVWQGISFILASIIIYLLSQK